MMMLRITRTNIQIASSSPRLAGGIRSFILMTICVCAGITPTWSADAATDLWAGATLHEPTIHDIGLVFPGAVVAHEFPLINDSAQVWDILDSKTSCTCIPKTDLPPSLAPGARAAFGLKFRAGQAIGAERARGWVLTRVAGMVSGRAFVVEYQVADYLELPLAVVRVDSEKPSSLKLKRGGHSDRWTRVEVDAGSSADRFVASLAPQSGDTWDLTIATVAGKHCGDINGRLKFSFFDGDRSLDHRQIIDVSARIPGSLIASPSSVLIGGITQGQARDMSVVLRARDDQPLPMITSVESLDPNRMQVTLAPQNGPQGKEVRLNLHFQATGALGKASSRVILHLDNGEIFHIPYLAAIAEAVSAAPGSSATP